MKKLHILILLIFAFLPSDVLFSNSIENETNITMQSSELAKQVMSRINEIRENPSLFLQKNRKSLEKYNANFIIELQNSPSLKAVEWDQNLEEMAKSVIENGSLHPEYKGDKKFCGFSSGNASFDNNDVFGILSRFYRNILDDDYKYFAIYFDKTQSKYAFQWGLSCERSKKTYVYTAKIDTSNVNFKSLNTGFNANYMSAAEKRMLMEINFVRCYPKTYSKIIAKYLSDLSKRTGGLNKSTLDAGLELISVLDTMRQMSILQPSECLFKAAKSHGMDCQKRGYFSHIGSDKSYPWDRALKFCSSLKYSNENGEGSDELNPRASVISILLDEGISTRVHRYNLLDRNWTIGVCHVYNDTNFKYFWIQYFGN